MTYVYDDGLQPAGRRPRLYLAKAGSAVKFTGENIPDVCAITAQTYHKNGKWSKTTYTLLLGAGVRAIELLSPMHRTWGDALQSWGEAVERLQLPNDVTRSIVGYEYPTTAKRLDAIEAFALSQAAKATTVEIVTVAFGSPTNRAIADGYWDSPKTGHTAAGEVVTVQPDPDRGWNAPTVTTPADASIVGSRHSPGMHGGYWTIEVAVKVRQEP